MNKETIIERFKKEFPISWWWSIGSGKGDHKNNYPLAQIEMESFLRQEILDMLLRLDIKEKKVDFKKEGFEYDKDTKEWTTNDIFIAGKMSTKIAHNSAVRLFKNKIKAEKDNI